MKKTLNILALVVILVGSFCVQASAQSSYSTTVIKATIAPGSTFTGQVDLEPLDSLQIVLNTVDSLSGRIKWTPYVTVNGAAKTITADSALVKTFTYLKEAVVTVSYAEIATAMSDSASGFGVLPTSAIITVVTNGTGTAYGNRQAAAKQFELIVKKYKHM